MPARAVLVLLVATALVAGAGLAIGAPTNLEVPTEEPDRTAYPAVSSDLGLAVQGGDADLRASFERAALEARYTDAQGAEREAVVGAYLDRLVGERRTLADRERTQLAALAADGAPTTAVRELVQIHAEAQAHADALSSVASLLDANGDINASHRAESLAHRFGVHTGPVRSELASVVRGGTPLHPRVTYAEDGLVLAAVADGSYVREAVRYDRLDASGPDQVTDIHAAIDLVETAYPGVSTTRAARALGDGWYLVSRSGPTGRVDALVSGPAGGVAHERQRHRVERIDDRQVETGSEDGLAVEVDYGPGAGPIGVAVERASDGTSVDAEVYLRYDATWASVGSTGPDGRLWVASPTGSIDVRVVAPDGSIATVTVG